MKTLLPFILFLISIIVFAQDEINVKVNPPYQKQIKKIVNNKKVKQAFEIIDQIDEETINDLIELTEIPAPPFMEEKRAERFMEMLKAAGADKVWIDEEGNVLALRKGTANNGKTIALDAHLDTVFPEGTDVKVKMKGDTLFAPGVGDDTRGLSMVIAILKSMEKAGIETESDVVFVGSVGEEGLGDLRGVKHIFE
ncbi:MAG: M20/M25/M40 family metallo-hydrolase, partial [Cyclobacteriaceae bacterium]|nr:M20/M25/M40 family metallo-hydrolase [Cyclobacteriaceae bacterium]